MEARAFPDLERVDARDKVLGRTRFAADFHFPDMLHAMLVPATIAKGRVVAIDTAASCAVPGVVRVLTAPDFPPSSPPKPDEPPSPLSPPKLIEDTVTYLGEPVALVLAETLAAAVEGAEAVAVRYSAEPFSPCMESEGAVRVPGKPHGAGDAERALAEAEVVIDEVYETPVQHHNPIELFATTAVWADGRLAIYDSTHAATFLKNAVAGALRLDPSAVDVKTAYIGGSFGQKGVPKRQTALIGWATMLTGRPVKLVTPRGQVFHLATHRPRTRHHLRLGANGNGRIAALAYDVTQENRPGGNFKVEDYHEGISRLYAIANYAGTGTAIHIDRPTPGTMRGTHCFGACFALESAVDELAWKLDRDPLELRLDHDATHDPLTGRPLSGRHLAECLKEGARRFGWERCRSAPGSMRLADGTMVGWGLACGIFHGNMSAADATLRIGADGTTRLVTGGHEVGQGIRTVIANVILRELDVDPDRLEIVIGDTSAAPQPITAGQWGTATVVPVTMKAVAEWKTAFAELAGDRRLGGNNIHAKLADLGRPYLEVSTSELAPGQPPAALDAMRKMGWGVAGPVYPKATSMSYIAHFVEVRIEPGTRRLRVPRSVSIADIGTVISPRTARSQMHGGAVWGLSTALREESEIDPRFAGYLNDDLADYVVAVNADVGDTEFGFIDRPDPSINRGGAKGMGELVMVGYAAAIANAIYHATGKRLRKLPVRLEDLLQ